MRMAVRISAAVRRRSPILMGCPRTNWWSGWTSFAGAADDVNDWLNALLNWSTDLHLLKQVPGPRLRPFQFTFLQWTLVMVFNEETFGFGEPFATQLPHAFIQPA